MMKNPFEKRENQITIGIIANDFPSFRSLWFFFRLHSVDRRVCPRIGRPSYDRFAATW
jgi:tRNA threonylcarbamoyladenosine modification (KEOPS) complex  Pcc1 subunit